MGDVFGRIYEYFLMKFAMQGAQDNVEFFTPPSIVQTIVNVIEPEHGIVSIPRVVLPACSFIRDFCIGAQERIADWRHGRVMDGFERRRRDR